MMYNGAHRREGKEEIRTARISDYDGLMRLWLANGISIRAGDDRRGIRTVLDRNPGLSLVAVRHGSIVGAAMGTWDGRRGWIHHLAVDASCRRTGIASRILSELEIRMKRKGVQIVKAEIYGTNSASLALFRKRGYADYTNLRTVGKTLTKTRNIVATGQRKR